jgi:hypothetical protein
MSYYRMTFLLGGVINLHCLKVGVKLVELFKQAIALTNTMMMNHLSASFLPERKPLR